MEASGEIQTTTEKPQPMEAKKNDANFGLSVNGSQIIALANLNYLEEHGFFSPARPNLLDRVKTLRYRPAHQRLNAISGLILEGNTQEAINLLDQGLVLANSISGVKNNKFVEGVEAIAIYSREILDALSKNISVKEACKDYLKFDKEFREFIQSLPGHPLYELPKESARVFLTQLGIEAYVNPKSNTLRLSPEDFLKGTVALPADRQHPLYIGEKEVFGEKSSEMTISRLEIFAELAKRYPKVFTHIARMDKLPTILQAGLLGKDYGRVKGNTQEKGLFVEELTFKDAPKYTEVIQQLKAGNDIAIPWDEINPNQEVKLASTARLGYNYPLHELTYIHPNEINPVAIFSDKLPEEHKLQGWLMDGKVDIQDKCLIVIWVTPTYRQHLLHWISTWTPEKRQEVFGERKPEEVLISSVKDLPIY